MSRLVHTRRGFHRAMQISKAELFTFMEGKSVDRYFYGRLCTSVCEPKGTVYEQVIGNQVPPGGSGGKEVLLGFFKYLRRKAALVDTFKGKTTRALFFLDKDIDDLSRMMLRSPHLIYTEFYHLENYLFRFGSLADAAASAASLDRNIIEVGLGDSSNWLNSRAENWHDWITLCVFSKTLKIGGQANYGIVSPLNKPPNSPTDPAARAALIAGIQAASGMAPAAFSQILKRVYRRINRIFRAGQHDRVFKGKWYAFILAQDIKAIAGGQPYDERFVQQKLLGSLPVTLDYDAAWSGYFKSRIVALLP
jgi:hypothetical protein